MSLRVMFHGTPAPNARWFRNAVPIFDSEAYSVTDGEGYSVLTVLKPATVDSGVFTCLLENTVGAVKTTANLSVLEGDASQHDSEGDDDHGQYMMSASTVTTRTLKEMQVAEGDTIRFDIQFKDGTKDQLRFRKNGEDLDEDDKIKVTVEGEVAALTIEKARLKEDSGLYECIMRTEGGEARVQVRVEVKPKQAN